MRCHRFEAISPPSPAPPPHPRRPLPCRCGFISTCRQLLQHFVEAHFPTNKALEDRAAVSGSAQEDWHDGDGSESTLQAGGERASPGRQGQRQADQQVGEEDPTSAELKAAMLQRIAALDLPPNFLDEVGPCRPCLHVAVTCCACLGGSHCRPARLRR